jgi:hypothetical protein
MSLYGPKVNIYNSSGEPPWFRDEPSDPVMIRNGFLKILSGFILIPSDSVMILNGFIMILSVSIMIHNDTRTSVHYSVMSLHGSEMCLHICRMGLQGSRMGPLSERASKTAK